MKVNAGWGINVNDVTTKDGVTETTTKNVISLNRNLGTNYTDKAHNGDEKVTVAVADTGLVLGGYAEDEKGNKNNPAVTYGATGEDSVTVGGKNSLASGRGSVVTGGVENIASGATAVAIGGNNNDAIGTRSAVLGGLDNTAFGDNSMVSGGGYNVAGGIQSAVLGGFSNYALGTGTTSIGGYGKDYETGYDSSVNGNYSVGVAGGSTGNDAKYALAAGHQAVVTTENGTAIGYQATTDEANTIAFGHDAGDVSGYTIKWKQLPANQFNADGTTNDYTQAPESVTENTYKAAAYNRLVKVTDGKDDHDVVVMEQLKPYTKTDASNIGKKLKKADGTTAADAADITKNENAWGAAIGTGSIADPTESKDNDPTQNGSQQLVTGGTVYNALHGGLMDITVGKAGKNGTDGKDGSIGLNGKNGKDGKDGITTTIIKTEKGQPGEKGETGAPGVDGKDITRIVYQNDKNDDGKHTVATLDDGMKYAGDDSQDTTKIIAKKLNETLNIIGGAKGDLSVGNIGVNNVDGSLKIQLAKDLKDLNSSTYTTTETTGEGDQQKTTTYTTVINGKGLTIQSGEQGSTTATSGPSITIDGINGGGKQITNIGDGITKDTEGNYTISDTNKKNAANIGDVQTIVDKATENLTEGTNGLNSKANIDASNIGDKLSYKADGTTVTVADKTANKNAWGAAIGTGVIADPLKTDANDPAANGSQQLVTGGTVYTALTNKANIDMDNISDNGKTVIRNLAKGAVKVVDGTLTTVTSKQDGDATAYMVNIKKGQVAQNDDGLVTGSAVYDAIQGAKLSGESGQTVDLSGKVNVSADNVGRNFSKYSTDATTDEAKKQEVTANENAWGNALGTGSIANSDPNVQEADSNGSNQLVTGNTVYKEVRPTSDGNYVKTGNTTAANLSALDTQLGKVSGSAVQYDTVQGGTTVDKTKLTLAGADGTTISNVKAGNYDTDAVNVKQLNDNVKQLNDKIADVTYTEGNGITFGTDKTISAKAGTGITVDAKGISVNLGKHLSASGTGAIDVEDNGTVTENNTDLVTGGTVYNALHGGLTDITVGKDGKDGSIGLNGKDGKDGIMTTIIKTEKGQPGEKGETGAPGVDGKDITRIVYQNAKNSDGKHTVATLDDGMKYAGDTGEAANVKLDHQLKLSGTTFGANNTRQSYDEKDWTSDNIAVVLSKVGDDGNAVMNLKLAKDLKDLNSSTYTSTETTGEGDQKKTTTYTIVINGKGLTIQSGEQGSTTSTSGPSITIDGINGGGKQITNIGDGITKDKNGNYIISDTDKRNAANIGDVQTIVNDAKKDLTEGTNGLNNKANVNASNIGSNIKVYKTGNDKTPVLDDEATKQKQTENKNAWASAIGTNEVKEGNNQLVTSDAVAKELAKKADKSYVDQELGKKADKTYVDEKLDTKANKLDVYTKKETYNKSEVDSKVTNIKKGLDDKANKDLGNITDAGKTVIKDLAKGSVKVIAGTNTTVAPGTDKDGATTYTVNVEGNGKVAAGDTGLISGGTLYNEVHVTTDGSYIKSNNTVGQNLSALDSGLKTTSDLIHTNTKGDTIQIGGNSTATKIDVNGKDGKGRVITGVVSDANDPNSAANVGYVNGLTAANTQQIYRDMNNAYSRLDTNINRAAAGSNALAALHPLDFDPADKASFAVGYGHYRNANAAAVGAFYQPNANTMVNMGVSLGNGDPGFNAGVSFKIGKGSAYNGVSKAEMAQTIHDQATEISAIKADDAAKDKRIDALEKENQEMKKQIQEILARLNG